MVFKHKHFLGIDHLSAADILTIMKSEDSFFEVSKREIKKVPALRGKTKINLFYEPLLLGGKKSENSD